MFGAPAHPLTSGNEPHAFTRLTVGVAFTRAARPVPGTRPGFTFASLLAIALDRQALPVALHPDHARPLSKMWHGAALGQDHVDLPSFHVQLLPLPGVDVLQGWSRHDVNTSISGGQKERPASQEPREGFCSPRLPPVLSLHPPALPPYLHCQTVPHMHCPPVNNPLMSLITQGNHSSFL